MNSLTVLSFPAFLPLAEDPDSFSTVFGALATDVEPQAEVAVGMPTVA